MCSMQTWRYSVTEYDPERSWVVVSTRRGMTVELNDDVPFWDWAFEEWPTPRYKVELEPYEQARHLRLVG